MQVTPQKEHQWLDKLIGEWSYESECSMGPDQPPSKTKGTEIVRSLSGLWTVAEGENEMPDGEIGKTIMSLGYDSQTDRYIGTFVCSMMAHLWLYSGCLDAVEKVLTLDTEGPNFKQTAMARYQDIIEFVSDDHRIMTSQILDDDGNWLQFMTAHYRRQQ
ncbi:MAG: DUF1579 domain-containing protein [Aphanocapsa sp. GSE-SYN-MK-11-07L]|jgi:hypothetical protein|nr:DUF1579 domain-containing protein [Aphanocapsa sp. GSE-SYN-MK-11-07L]